MDLRTVRTAAQRIAEHADEHGLARVHVVLHGGEPLLLGLNGLRATLTELRGVIESVTQLDLRLQSNGVLVTPVMADLLAEFRVKVGISLDGDKSANDRHRRFANGASSHPQVLRALALLRRPAYRDIYAGLLCTVDIANDPIAVYEALLAEEPPQIDLLLPHATWDRPPPRPDGDRTGYGAWLARVYTRWIVDGRPVPIRLFDSLLSVATGGPSLTEAVGLNPADLVVIETDGAWEQADSLKAAYHGAPATGLNVFSHSVEDAAGHPGIAIRRAGLGGVCQTCRTCPVVHRCGGGLFAHRYRSGTGFDNPSVYCADLKELIATMDAAPAGATGSVPALGSVPGAVLDELGSGRGEAEALRSLTMSQLSITRALVAVLGNQAVPNTPAAAGWALLARLDVEAPDAVRTVLTHPYVRTWAVLSLDSTRGTDPDPDRAYLACLAAAAAVHAGADVDLDVPLQDGMLHLPTLGRLLIGSGVGRAAVSCGHGGFVTRAGGSVHAVRIGDRQAQPEGWQPTRHLRLGGVRVALEDTDPFRDCHQWPVAARLSGTAVDSWRRVAAAAWLSIRRTVPEHLPGLRIMLRSLAPLRHDGTGRQRSATSRHAFGAIGVAAVADPDALAVMLVHEMQHLKLGAVLDLCDLVDPGYRGRLSVGWRPDPRPLEAALSGAYAHLAVADVWRARRVAGGRHAPVADGRFRQYREWVSGAIDALLSTGALTHDGERFVDRMRRTVESWYDDRQ
jgi:uncharacterized protein